MAFPLRQLASFRYIYILIERWKDWSGGLPPLPPNFIRNRSASKSWCEKVVAAVVALLKGEKGKIWVRIFKQALFNTTLGFHNELRPGWSSHGQESPKGDGKTATGRRLLRFQADGAIYAIIPTCKKGLVKVMERKRELSRSWSGQRFAGLGVLLSWAEPRLKNTGLLQIKS